MFYYLQPPLCLRSEVRDIRWSHDRHWRPFLSFSLPLHRHDLFQPHELSSQTSPVMVTTSSKFNPMTHTFKVFRHRLPAMSSLPYHHFDCPYHQCIPTNSPRVCCRLLPQAQSHVNPAVYLAGLAATDFTISPWLDLTADSTISPCRYSQTPSTLSPASSAHFVRRHVAAHCSDFGWFRAD